jgi:predicted nucleic acid-binding protein
MRLYFDTCCFNRPFDDQSQKRVRLESESILAIIDRGLHKLDEIVGSEILDLEIEQISDIEKAESVKELYSVVSTKIEYSQELLEEAEKILKISSIQSIDSLHIASAQKAKVDVFLTTDDKLQKECSKINLSIKVKNPIKYILEVIGYE